MSTISESSEYVYLRNHHLHIEYARLCVKHVSAAYTPWAGRRSQLFRNLFSLLQSIGKPRRKIFLIEGPGAVSAILLRRSRNCRVLMFNTDPTFYRLKEQNGFQKWLTLYLLSKVDAVLSPAQLMVDMARPYLPEKYHAVFHLYVDTERWRPLPFQKDGDFLNIGRADRFKNQELVLRAFRAIKARHGLNIQLHVIGNIYPGYEKVLLPLMDSSVHVTGWIKHPWDNIPASSYYFNLANLEPSGTNILEALALGLPPIVSTGCGYAEDIVAEIDRKLIVPLEEAKVIEAWEYLHFMGEEDRLVLREKCLAMARKWNRERAYEHFRTVFFNGLTT